MTAGEFNVERWHGSERRRGRPREISDPSHLTARVDGALHTRIVEAAARAGKPVSVLVRELLETALREYEARQHSVTTKPTAA
jgi:predicted HicB family RNase H-like nuclease